MVGFGEDGAEGALHVALLLAGRGLLRSGSLPLGEPGGLDGLQQRGQNHRDDEEYRQHGVQLLGAGVGDEDGAEGEEKREA